METAPQIPQVFVDFVEVRSIPLSNPMPLTFSIHLVFFLAVFASSIRNSVGLNVVPNSIASYVSDGSGMRLASQPAIEWGKRTAVANIEISVDEKYQQFDGIGGSFMRSGAFLLNQMPSSVKEQMLRDLFHPTEGAGFVLGKIPIGATDFGIPKWYTYADEPQPSSLPLFSIEPDLDPVFGFIPFVKDAMRVAGRPLRLEATMDYPPQWMLNSSTPLPQVFNASVDLACKIQLTELPLWCAQANLNSTTLEALASYYLRYVEALNVHAIRIEFLSLFNENPDSYTAASDDLVYQLLVQHVAPLFQAQTSIRMPLVCSNSL